jgi:hypothetical protein
MSKAIKHYKTKKMKKQIPQLNGTAHALASGTEIAAFCYDFENVVIGSTEWEPRYAAHHMSSNARANWFWRIAQQNGTLYVW